MTMQDLPRGAQPPEAMRDGEVAAQHLLTVRDCNRLGRRANPPGFSLGRWLRAGRD